MPFSDPGQDRQILWSEGPAAPKLTLAGTVKRGDVIGYSTGWKRALATVSGVIQGRFIALSDGVSGDVIPVSGRCLVAGFTGATPGDPVYVAEGTSNGQVTQTLPNTTNDATTVVGIAMSATEIYFFLNSRADSLSA
jgi:hypothetical protein